VHRLHKFLALFLAGGFLYSMIEWAYKSLHPGGITHWSMFVIGGLMFVLIGEINQVFPWEMPLLLQGVIGSVMITEVELISGCYLNLYLGLHVWNYSKLPFNLFGQICPEFSLIWVLLAMVAVVLDDWLRYWWFGEDRPHYILL
jgi:uncharacterized membrane protein